MAERLEAPDPSRHEWEQSTIVLPSETLPPSNAAQVRGEFHFPWSIGCCSDARLVPHKVHMHSCLQTVHRMQHTAAVH